MKVNSITIVFENLDEITFPVNEVKTLTFYGTIAVDRLIGKNFERRKVATTACIEITNLLNTSSIVTNSGFHIKKFTPAERLSAFPDICSVFINYKSGKSREYVMNWPDSAPDEINPYQSSTLSEDKNTITIKIAPPVRKSLKELFDNYDGEYQPSDDVQDYK